MGLKYKTCQVALFKLIILTDFGFCGDVFCTVTWIHTEGLILKPFPKQSSGLHYTQPYLGTWFSLSPHAAEDSAPHQRQLPTRRSLFFKGNWCSRVQSCSVLLDQVCGSAGFGLVFTFRKDLSNARTHL